MKKEKKPGRMEKAARTLAKNLAAGIQDYGFHDALERDLFDFLTVFAQREVRRFAKKAANVACDAGACEAERTILKLAKGWR